MLIEAPMACHEEARHVDVLCFTKSVSGEAVLPLEHHADGSNISAAVNNEEDDQSNTSEKDNVLNDVDADKDVDSDKDADTDGDATLDPHVDSDKDVDPDKVASATLDLHVDADKDEDAQQPLVNQPSETLDDTAKAEPEDEDLEIAALEATTSVHDDWLHRGLFLYDMDFHTYIRFTVRKPRPKDVKVSDADRAEHIFLFDPHYAMAASHWQQLVTEGLAKLVVMEALRCPLPTVNNGEDNAVFKSLIGTLLKCPGPGHCADPLFCKAGFFQVTVPESSKQTAASELPDWIDHDRFTRYKCPLAISRRTHADDVASTWSCRLHWKARRAEIEVLAKQAISLCDAAKRIPVLADTTLLRAVASSSAGRPAHLKPAAATTAHGDGAPPPTWSFLLCFTQLWMQKNGQPFPPYARMVLQYLDKDIHHPHQISLSQFCAYHLREIIFNLDMIAIARTTKLTATSKENRR